MRIYYINLENFIKTHDTDFLKKYTDGREFKSVKRFTEYTTGRYLVKTVAKEIYGLENTEIIIENDKPKFKNGGLHFSISHSGEYIAAAFDEHECGLDIEKIKPRDLTALSKRYEREFETQKDFYEFWTEYEAFIKLQAEKICGKYTCVFQEDYVLTVVSTREITELSTLPCIIGLKLY